MKQHVRRFSRKVGRKIDNVRSYATTLVRSNSDYNYHPRSINVTSTLSPSISDTDDDLVFEGTAANELSTDDTRRGSITRLPCEFCHALQSSENLTHHQYICPQNPTFGERRRYLTINNPTDASRRRATSDNISAVPPPVPRRMHSPPVVPSAPPRSRSPSPTEGFTIPDDLLCPIMRSLFRDPVVANDGHTYERSAITDWIRTAHKSPLTRQEISIEKLNANRIIKKMADEFRAECKRKRALYKYRLDIDVKQMEEIRSLKSNTRTVYRAEWIKNNSPLTDTKIILTHLTGENAEKLGEINCQLGPHPNIVRTFGRVEHNGTGILLLQEYFPEQTLAELIRTADQKFPISVLDTIIYQIAFALEHLAQNGIVYGAITVDNIFVYRFDENPENILIKLTNIGDPVNETGDDEVHSEKTDVYDFGKLLQELYALELATNDEDLIERQHLTEYCLATDPNIRPTFDKLTKSIFDLMHKKKFIF